MIHAKYKQESTRPRQKLKPVRIRIAMNIGRSLIRKMVVPFVTISDFFFRIEIRVLITEYEVCYIGTIGYFSRFLRDCAVLMAIRDQ